uniref:Uncharacterized protein n=1 Tax=Chenopodium quinoa TaxID=63459 RepID=A0A803MPU7_CHEQI
MKRSTGFLHCRLSHLLVFMAGVEELSGVHVEEHDVSSHGLEFIVGQLENPFVCSDEDKLMFSGIAVSLNLNLGACFIKVKDYDRVGQLCSAVLCFDTTNVKAYFKSAIAALELNKTTLAFMDLAQALKIDPNNSEFQQKLEADILIGLVSGFR